MYIVQVTIYYIQLAFFGVNSSSSRSSLSAAWTRSVNSLVFPNLAAK